MTSGRALLPAARTVGLGSRWCGKASCWRCFSPRPVQDWMTRLRARMSTTHPDSRVPSASMMGLAGWLEVL